MGLAPYGDPSRFRAFFREAVKRLDDGRIRIPLLRMNQSRARPRDLWSDAPLSRKITWFRAAGRRMRSRTNIATWRQHFRNVWTRSCCIFVNMQGESPDCAGWLWLAESHSTAPRTASCCNRDASTKSTFSPPRAMMVRHWAQRCGEPRAAARSAISACLFPSSGLRQRQNEIDEAIEAFQDRIETVRLPTSARHLR